MHSRNDKFTVVDLFAGAGGFSCASKKMGFHILAAIENDYHATETYKRNFIWHKKNAPILFKDDITILEPEQVVKAIREKFCTCQVDVVVGGPPCQGFSQHRFKNTGVDDPRNALLLRYFHYIHVISPKFFLLENVCGLLWERHSAYLNQFYVLAKQNGYEIEPPVVLDAKNYGVPQNRNRVFILGRRKDIVISPEYRWPPNPTHFPPDSTQVNLHGFSPWRTAADVFNVPIAPQDPNAIHMHHSDKLVKVFASTPPNGGNRTESNRILPCHLNHHGHKDVYGRICLDLPGPTMTTGCTNPSKGRFLHPFENHGISIRHAARFQTFPDDFVFPGGIIAASRQIGNAVPVRLGEVVLGVILKELTYQKEKGHE